MAPPKDPTFENDNVKEIIIMATKKEQLTRVTMSQKHDIEAHWELAKNLVPKAGVIIVYDPDETHDYARFKCGDGVTKVNDLPFIFKIDENYATKEYVNDAVANVTIDVDTTLTKEGEAADAKAVGDKFNNYETKENVQKITDELAKVKETAEDARTEEEVNAQIDAKVNALELKKTYEPIGAETRAKTYADALMTDANLDQYTTEKEVKEIVDTIVADAVSGDAVTGLANLVEYFHTHGEEAAQMGAAITELEGEVKKLNEAPSASIKATDIINWNEELGAKALAKTKTTAEEVKTQIEAYKYATEQYVNNAVANVTIEVDSTLTEEGKAADARAVGDAMTYLFINTINSANDAELFYLMEDGTIVTDKQALQQTFGITTDIFYHIVDTIPSDHALCTLTENHIYVLRETGIGYIDIGNGVQSLAERMGIPTDGLEQRWSPDINAETVPGIYAIPKVTTVRTVSTLPQYGVVDQLFKKQELGLTLLYINDGSVSEWLPVFNMMLGFTADDGSTPFVPFSSAEYHLINSLDNTDGCIQMILNSGGTIHFYIDAATGFPYIATSNGFTSAQLFVTAQGWIEDIEAGAEAGVYATYTNRGGVEYYRFNGRAWKRIDSAIVDVKILPKKNIDNSIIYRIPSKATAYIVQGVGNYAPLEDYTPDNYEIFMMYDNYVKVFFEEYSVAPYAFGEQTVDVPY